MISIRPDTLINEMDQDIMEEIFYTADRIGDNITENGVVGALRDYAIGDVGEDVSLPNAQLLVDDSIVDDVTGGDLVRIVQVVAGIVGNLQAVEEGGSHELEGLQGRVL